MTTDHNQSPNGPPELSPTHRAQLLHDLLHDPMARVDYFESPDDEVLGNTSLCCFGIFRREEMWDVWAYDVMAHPQLIWEQAFPSREQAQTHILRRADEVKKASDAWLNEQKDLGWEEIKYEVIARRGPFVFSDNTDYRHGLNLETVEDVIEFFSGNTYLLREQEWGNAYSCELLDGEGKPCWILVTHRDELLLIFHRPGIPLDTHLGTIP